MKQLIEITESARHSTESTSKKQELNKIINALSNPESNITKDMLRETFKNILLIALQHRKLGWYHKPLFCTTDSGKMIRNELRQDKYADLRELLNIVISDMQSGLRYRDLRGHLTGEVGEEATKKGGFFLQDQSIATRKNPLMHDAIIGNNENKDKKFKM